MSTSAFATSDCVSTVVVPEGVSLRDYLAGQALAGFMRVRDGELFNEQKIKWYAKIAYELADAMLDERAQAESKGVPLPKPAAQPNASTLWRQLGVTPS